MFQIWINAPQVEWVRAVTVICHFGNVGEEEAKNRFQQRLHNPVLTGLSEEVAAAAVTEFHQIPGVRATAEAV